MLNVRVIMRMRKESWLRVLERIVLPFFLNDHFPGDYVKALAEGKIEIVVQDTAQFGGIEETETGSPVQNGYFSFFTRGKSALKASANIPIKNQGYGSEAALERTTITGREKGLNIISDQLSTDNDSGYGAGRRSDEAPRARRRIVKYACDQDADESQRDFGRREPYRRSWHDDGAEDYNDDIGETHWRGLASEPRRGSNKSTTLRRSRSSSLSGSVRQKMRMQKERRGSVEQKPQLRW